MHEGLDEIAFLIEERLEEVMVVRLKGRKLLEDIGDYPMRALPGGKFYLRFGTSREGRTVHYFAFVDSRGNCPAVRTCCRNDDPALRKALRVAAREMQAGTDSAI